MWERIDTSARSAWGPAGVAVIVGGVTVGAVLATLVVGDAPREPSAGPARGTATTRSLPATPAAPQAPAPLGPEATVRHFYRRLGQRRFEALYALVGEDFRARASLAEYAERRRGVQQVSVRSVGVERLAQDRARAEIDVLIVDRGGPERCTGRLALTRTGARWRIDPGTVACR